MIDPDLVASVNDNGEQIYVDRFGRETTIDKIADDNFSEGKGARSSSRWLGRLSPRNWHACKLSIALTLAKRVTSIEITNDPMRFKATREAGNTDSSFGAGLLAS